MCHCFITKSKYHHTSPHYWSTYRHSQLELHIMAPYVSSCSLRPLKTLLGFSMCSDTLILAFADFSGGLCSSRNCSTWDRLSWRWLAQAATLVLGSRIYGSSKVWCILTGLHIPFFMEGQVSSLIKSLFWNLDCSSYSGLTWVFWLGWLLLCFIPYKPSFWLTDVQWECPPIHLATVDLEWL